MNKVFSILFFITAVVLFTGCKGGKEKANVAQEEFTDPRMDSQMERSFNDSVAILSITQEYLNLLKDKKYDDALSMVYDVDSTGITPITEQKKKEMMLVFNNFPVLDYEIVSMHLFSEEDVEVRYSVKFFELSPEQKGMPNTINMAISPRRVNGQWYITVPGKMMENNFN